MSSKLYVSNLGQAATLSSMRELFGTCGDVLVVEFAAERGGSQSPRTAAYITMATTRGADRALSDLHGRVHGDRVLMISRVAGEPAPSRAAPVAASAKDGRLAMTQQYRDRRGLTYELSGADKLLTLRFLFPLNDEDEWQIEAKLTPGAFPAVTSRGMTRDRAFKALVEAWQGADDQGGSVLDWEGVAGVLRSVKAF